MKEDYVFEFNGFKYSKNGIQYPNEIQFPSHLFKYYSINENSLDSFNNNYLYFSHPYQLNDILDCSPYILNFEGLSRDDYEGFFKYLSKFNGFDNNLIFSFADAKNENFNQFREIIYTLRMSNIGILSLTENPFNKLMIPHYTNERGFILDFDSNKIAEFLKLLYGNDNVSFFPMNYVKNIEPINFSKTIIKTETIKNDRRILEVNYNIPISYISNIKDNVWGYENEWRVLLKKSGLGIIHRPDNFNSNTKIDYEKRKIIYEKKCLNRVLLSQMFFNNNMFSSNDLVNKVNYYSLNVEKLTSSNILNSFRFFLSKLASSEMKDKIYIQNIGFNNENHKRVCQKLENIKFSNDIFSFYINPNDKPIVFGVKPKP